jgi:Kef-type K+ transport system membrane component KefB
MVIREKENFADKIEKQMRPIVFLFTPIFFVTVGLSVNMQDINWSEAHVWLFGGSVLLVAVVGKMLLPFFVNSLTFQKRVIVGLSMVPRGEVGLIFAEIGRTAGIFDTEVYAALIVVIILTTVLPPLLIKIAYEKIKKG